MLNKKVSDLKPNYRLNPIADYDKWHVQIRQGGGDVYKPGLENYRIGSQAHGACIRLNEIKKEILQEPYDSNFVKKVKNGEEKDMGETSKAILLAIVGEKDIKHLESLYEVHRTYDILMKQLKDFPDKKTNQYFCAYILMYYYYNDSFGDNFSDAVGWSRSLFLKK